VKRARSVHREVPGPRRLVARRLQLAGDDFAVLEWHVEPLRPPVGVTAAERDVLRLIMRGLSNKEIGRERGTSERTIANQVACLLEKFRVGSRYELLARALQAAGQRVPER
jgi:DNA-binding NarL/FixJ family response regulator